LRKWFTKRALLWHLLLSIIVPGCLIAAWWQVHRAMQGNTLSYGYSVEWPIFAIVAIIGWWQLIHEDPADVEARKEERRNRSKPVFVPATEDLFAQVGAHPELLDAFPDLALALPELVRAFPELAEKTHLSLTTGPVGDRLAHALPSASSPSPSRPSPSSAPVLLGAEEGPAPSDDLRAYNSYLAELAAQKRPKTWRNPHGR
jgi:hypothetical protein